MKIPQINLSKMGLAKDLRGQPGFLGVGGTARGLVVYVDVPDAPVVEYLKRQHNSRYDGYPVKTKVREFFFSVNKDGSLT